MLQRVHVLRKARHRRARIVHRLLDARGHPLDRAVLRLEAFEGRLRVLDHLPARSWRSPRPAVAIAVARLYSSSSFTSLPMVPFPLRMPSAICAASLASFAPDAAICFKSALTSTMQRVRVVDGVADGHDGALHVGLHFVDRVVHLLDRVAHLLHEIGDVERLLAGNRRVRRPRAGRRPFPCRCRDSSRRRALRSRSSPTSRCAPVDAGPR